MGTGGSTANNPRPPGAQWNSAAQLHTGDGDDDDGDDHDDAQFKKSWNMWSSEAVGTTRRLNGGFQVTNQISFLHFDHGHIDDDIDANYVDMDHEIDDIDDDYGGKDHD